MKVLYVCAELFPFLKTGGLADVGAGLPPALRALGCDVRILMPAFPTIARVATSTQLVSLLPDGPMPWGGAPALPATDVALATLPGLALPLYLVRSPALYERPGNPYLGPDGKEWGDNALRFAALAWAAATLGQRLDRDWVPDVIHCHDWHTGLAPAYVRAFADAGRAAPSTVFTIHNLAYQGLFPAAVFPQLGLPAACFDVDGLEFFGQVSFMKAAITYADRITTVSPTYAREILSEPQGCGLDGLLRQRANLLSGVLNGVDYQVWSPATDALLATQYDLDTLAEKSTVKRALQTELGLEQRANALVFGVVSRLTEQKGLHLLPPLLAELVQRGGQLALLGQGDAALEQAFVDAAIRYPGQVGVRIGYDEATAHAVVAGADVILVPSAFEPCGLTQLYGLRYGTLPLVRRVGGLADTVVDCTLENLDDGSATGFVFDDPGGQGLFSAMRRAFVLFRRPDEWAAVQRRGMGLRFDWLASARHYVAIYQSLRAGAKSGVRSSFRRV
ncbi:glycogen synthase GlgA [Rhodoferax sp.]|uniref:glycogen synthase GlgA n=1 Tax=Rhodoferax sp. TaxID=50421 RepID=UPI00271C0DBC|nr:glycogen synthase GlgA [Rhodoferax sp.]MDO9198013.1 glycogen synthase GlgA [Rhodoferax sp.]